MAAAAMAVARVSRLPAARPDIMPTLPLPPMPSAPPSLR
jgi:hypothetical protein